MTNLLTLAGNDIFGFVSEAGQLALFIILGIEEAGIPLPIPGDMILLFTGYSISSGHLQFWPAFFWSVAGVVSGASILFWLFRLGGRPFAHKYGKFILLPVDRLNKLDAWFQRKGRWAVLLGRFVPGLRVFVSAIAGLSGLPYLYFLPQIILASILWVLLFMLLGMYLGNNWRWGADTLINHSYIFFFIFLGLIGFYIWRERKKK